jgi:CheY-like chemotaxis protein
MNPRQWRVFGALVLAYLVILLAAVAVEQFTLELGSPAGDRPIFRDGLAASLRAAEGVTIADTAADGETAMGALEGVDVVVMDLNLPSMSGVEATRRIGQLPDPPAVLVVTMVDDDDAVLAAMRAGARGLTTARRRREQRAHRAPAAAVPQDRAELRVPHRRQAAGR